MANSITLAQKYIDELDKVYKYGAKTSVLDAAPGSVKAAANAGTFLIKKISTVGLGNYSKTTGYPAGDVSVTWETHTYNYDRGRAFTVDAMDDLEAMGVIADAAAEFIRTQVTPEIDALRMSLLANVSGIQSASADLTDAAGWVAALNTAQNAMDDEEVPEENRVLFIAGTGKRLVENAARDAATTDALERAQVITVPLRRRHATVTLNAGATAGVGGFTMSGEHINFLLMDKTAAFADAKHTKMRIFTPDENQSADAYLMQYRIYHDLFPYENKVGGIYCHTSANAANASTPTGTP